MKTSNRTKIKLLKWLISAGILALAVWMALSLTGCSYFERYPANNILEEFVEEVIEVKTGWEIDLSPWDGECD